MKSRPRSLKQAVDLLEAENLFRKAFFAAVSKYEEGVREGNGDPIRARWSKEDIIGMCKWRYPKDWRMLRERLERELGLIMLRQGAGNPWRAGPIKVWTFATCPEDREWGVINAVSMQLGGMKRTAKVTSLALAPPDEKHALDAGSKARIDEALEKQDVKLDDILKTLQGVKQVLIDRETTKLLEEYTDYEEYGESYE